jgi:hypothetical protein
MSKQRDNIDSDLAAWITRQRVFFVATAPLSANGHINASPKGGDAFRVLGPLEVAYQDYTGSVLRVRRPADDRSAPREWDGSHTGAPAIRGAGGTLSSERWHSRDYPRRGRTRFGFVRLFRAMFRFPRASGYA